MTSEQLASMRGLCEIASGTDGAVVKIAPSVLLRLLDALDAALVARGRHCETCIDDGCDRTLLETK